MSIDKSNTLYFSFASIHNTRLFPKNRGPEGYQVTGIAARCDWQVISYHDGRCILYRNGIDNPKTIFLSLRGFFPAFEYFKREVLPLVCQPFILISGSEDITIPNQLDRRWSVFDDTQRAVLEHIRSDVRLIAWFAENLDELKPKMMPLPTGYVFPGSGVPIDFVKVANTPLSARPLQALCAHRIREGSQWELRRRVSTLCQGKWKIFTHLIKEEVALEDFMALVRVYPFVLCTEGGGLDPSPKAWLTLALGSIPVMRRSPTTAAYESALPVVLVDEWDANALSPAIMRRWIERLSPWIEYPDLRKELEFRLSIDYWWNHIQASFLEAQIIS